MMEQTFKIFVIAVTFASPINERVPVEVFD